MTAQNQPLLTWLHLSDLHFGHGPVSHGWDQRLVLDVLRKTVRDRRRKKSWPRIDLILVTGDIAYSGGGLLGGGDTANDEYPRAAQWLAALAAAAGLESEAVYVVPGNHDVDRGRDDDRDIVRFIASLRAGGSIDEALSHQADREKLRSRQESYVEFAQSWAAPCRRGELFWVHRATSRAGLRYRLAGMNTALLCADNQDRGKLAVGNEQLVRLLVDEPIESDELVIALSHHPLTRGWLSDESGFWHHIRARAHLHISGHLHEPHSEWSQTGSGDEIVTVVAGAAHAEAKRPDSVPATHGFNLTSVVRYAGGGMVVEVRPFRWSRDRFVPDVDNLPTNRDCATHPLKADLAPVPERIRDDPGQPADDETTLRQGMFRDLWRIFADDSTLASCFAVEYDTGEPEELARALSSAPLAESLGRFFSVYEAPGRKTRLQASSGFREVITVILRLATQWERVRVWSACHATGDRHFRLAPFRKTYVAQIVARQIQRNKRMGLERGDSAPHASDVVEVGLDPGTDPLYSQVDVERLLWEQAMGSRLEEYDPQEHREDLHGNLRALADQKRQLVVLVDEARPAVRPDVAGAIPSVLLFERCQDGESCFLIDEVRLGRLLNDILHTTGG